MHARRRRRRRTDLTVAVAVTLVLAACGGDGDDDDASDTSDTTAATELETTTSTAPASTTSSTTSSTTGEVLGDEPTYRDDAASGSGCAPGGDELPDGWWYGRLSGAPGGTLELDLACFYVGPAAEAEAASRGDEVENDYYVVNDNPAVRTVPVAEDATASCVQLEAELEMVDCAPGEVAGDWTVWVRVADGAVDRIREQYLP